MSNVGICWFLGAVFCLLAASSTASELGPEITFEGQPPLEMACYAKYEVGFQISRQYANPFDPEQISVEAVFVTPSGKTVRVPGFYYQDYPEHNVRQDDKFEGASGPACWKIRFTPREPGQYQGKIIANDHAGRTEVDLPPVRVVPSDSPGFIHCTTGDTGRTVFDSGKMFMPIGECLWMPRTLEQFEKELVEYNEHGMNYFRFFTSHDSMFFFQNARQPSGQYDLFTLST